MAGFPDDGLVADGRPAGRAAAPEPTSPIGAILDTKGVAFYYPTDIFKGLTGEASGFTSAVWNL